MEGIISDYFSQIFTSCHPDSYDEALVGINQVVIDDMDVHMESEPMVEDIKQLFFKCTLRRLLVWMIFMLIFSRSFGLLLVVIDRDFMSFNSNTASARRGVVCRQVRVESTRSGN